MNDQQIIFLLAFIGWATMILTRYKNRDTTTGDWFKENWLNAVLSAMAVCSLMLIGPGDDVDLGSYVARTWAAGLGLGAGYLVSGNVQPKSATDRRQEVRQAVADKKVSDNVGV